MRLLVCGGRNYSDKESAFAALDAVNKKRRIEWIIHGGAKGADSLADEWANIRGIDVVKFVANWSMYGAKAGPIRNQEMIDFGRPEGVVAFPGGKGTQDMISRAKKYGITVWEPF